MFSQCTLVYILYVHSIRVCGEMCLIVMVAHSQSKLISCANIAIVRFYYYASFRRLCGCACLPMSITLFLVLSCRYSSSRHTNSSAATAPVAAVMELQCRAVCSAPPSAFVCFPALLNFLYFLMYSFTYFIITTSRN